MTLPDWAIIFRLEGGVPVGKGEILRRRRPLFPPGSLYACAPVFPDLSGLCGLWGLPSVPLRPAQPVDFRSNGAMMLAVNLTFVGKGGAGDRCDRCADCGRIAHCWDTGGHLPLEGGKRSASGAVQAEGNSKGEGHLTCGPCRTKPAVQFAVAMRIRMRPPAEYPRSSYQPRRV